MREVAGDPIAAPEQADHPGKEGLRARLPSIDRALFWPKAFYFCFYAAGASLVPFLALYYRELGLSSAQIGFLVGVSPLITLFSAPLWGAGADALQRHRALFLAAIASAWMAVLALARASSFPWIVTLAALYAFCGAPIIPLVDNSVLSLLGQRRNQYGRQRVWGAIGWGVAGPIMGALIEQTSLPAIFAGYLLWMGCGFLIATRLPVPRARLGVRFMGGLRRLLANRQWAIFLLTVFLGGMGISLTNNFLFLYMSDIGGSESLMGLALAMGTVSEMPVLFFSDRLLRRWGARGVLTFSLAACVARAFGYALMTAPWTAVLLQLLHGPTFSALWAAGVAYAHAIAPPGMGATAQGMFTATALGLAAAIGAFLGGIIYQAWGGASLFGAVGGIALAGLVLWITAGRESAVATRP